MADFNEIEKKIGAKFEYAPNRPVEAKEEDFSYYGPTLGKPVLDEITVLMSVVNGLKDGLPKPFDSSIIIDKISSIEQRSGSDLTALKNCCPPSAEVREAKEFKPLIYGILDRIEEIAELGKYVKIYR